MSDRELIAIVSVSAAVVFLCLVFIVAWLPYLLDEARDWVAKPTPTNARLVDLSEGRKQDLRERRGRW